jgi:hypothetical protein
VPRLGQIREGKESKHSRSRASSTVSSAIEPRTRRRRRIEDHAVDRARDRYTHGTSQRHASSLSKMSNPSVVSVGSEVTQEANVSKNSSASAAQRTIDDKKTVEESESEEDTDDSEDSRAPEQMSVTEVEAGHQPSVFQYMQEEPTVEEYSEEEESHDDLPSNIATSYASGSDDSEQDDTRSSIRQGHAHHVPSLDATVRPGPITPRTPQVS